MGRRKIKDMGYILQLIAHLLRFITLKIDKLMATVEEISAKADILQQTLDAVQDKVSTGTAAVQAEIANLRAQIASGASAPQLQAIADKLDAAIADIGTTVIPEVPQA